MNSAHLARALLVSSLLVAPACGGDDGSSSTGNATEGSTDSDGTAGTSGSASATMTTSGTTTASSSDSSTDPTPGTSTTETTTATGGTTSAGTTTDGTSGSGGTTDSSGGTGGACTSWVVTYDLTGSKMNIDALVDFEITVEEPYSDDDKMGPGTMKIRFTDDGGAIGNGTAQIIDYQMDQNFVTGSFGTDVTTDLVTWSGPDACGTASGAFDGTDIVWGGDLDPLCQDGTVSCTGGFCGMSGAPPANAPFVFDMDCTGTMALNDFVFTNGTDSFTMAPTVLSMENGQTTTLSFVGTATGTMEDASTPMCACG